METGQIKFLNLYGDITIEWSEKDHLKMIGVIEEKLKEGFQFFIVKKKFLGIPFTGGKKELKKISSMHGNKVLIKDESLEKYFNDISSAEIINDKTESHEIVKNSTNPEEIAKSSSVCSKPPQRG